MPLLGALFTTLFGGVVTFFAAWFTKKVAMTIAAILLMTAITVTMVTGINALFSGLTAVIPSYLAISASWIVPDNLSVCMTAIISAQLLRWVYDWNANIIWLKMS